MGLLRLDHADRWGGAILLVLLAVAVTGCTAVRKTSPQRTAIEQLLISRAADRAAERLTVGLRPGTKVYLNADTFEALDEPYALGAIRSRILESGAQLVGIQSDAEVVIDARAGALSIDESETLVGIPSINVPIPLTGPLQTPEIALFKRQMERGVAKFAITAYDSKTGRLVASSGPVYGFSHRQKFVVLLFLSWTSDDILPSKADEQDILAIPWE